MFAGHLDVTDACLF